MQRQARRSLFESSPGCAALLLAAFLGSGCEKKEVSTEARPDAASVAPAVAQLDRLTRAEFNARAIQLDQPLFWRADANGNGAIEPDELAVTWGRAARRRAEFAGENGRFTPAFLAIYEAMQKPPASDQLPSPEKARRDAVQLELAQGRPTLIESDFSQAPEADRNLALHLLRAATFIERLHARQKGTFGMDAKIAPGDRASAALFFRNQGPFCAAPKTEGNPDCNALPEKPKPVYGLYPPAIQSDKQFCEHLEKQANAKELLDHFSVVAAGGAPNAFRAVKYSAAFDKDMASVADELVAGAAALTDEEAALKKYLLAAAQSFRDDNWEPANEAWVAMSGHSQYYLRVAPDEVYYEPCAWKAGFALTFARINQESLAWQQRLEPIKQEMEDDLARLAGKPYKARPVKFKLPDFIDVVLNAGEARSALGATVGQSLPNWGPVADRGGRTVAMVNLYTDADSQKSLIDQMASTYCPGTMDNSAADPKSLLMGVVLHEAVHNLGPAHEYKVNGKVDDAAFGGTLASTLEELKAQTGALYFPAKLAEKKLVSDEEVKKARIREVAWVFANVAQGMYDAEGKPKNYAQLASIQLGSLQSAGVLEWKPGAAAANGSDRGCFDIHFEKWNGATAELMQKVLSIKSRGDRAAAEQLKKQWVDSDDDGKKQRDVIAERWLRAPRASFVYSFIGLDR